MLQSYEKSVDFASYLTQELCGIVNNTLPQNHYLEHLHYGEP